jgi:hypothetical protein
MHNRTHATHSFPRAAARRKWMRTLVFSGAWHNWACSINYY